MNKLETYVKEVLEEATKVNFGDYKFLLKVDTNEDPQKMGVRVSFIPMEFGKINSTTQNDIAIELESRLERGLAEFGLRVERDRAVKDKSIIRFFIYIEYFDRLIRKALSSQNPSKQEKDSDALEAAKLPGASDIE